MSSQGANVVEANHLYWDTEESVASIADQLDLSRRALYDALQPLAAGVSCTACGAELTFENRSARKLGTAACSACGAREQIMEPSPRQEPSAPALTVVRGDAPEDRLLDLRDPDLRHRAVVLGGAAIAGVAVGTVAAILAMRRD